MKTTNITLMAEARHALSGKWGITIGAFVVSGLVSLVARIIPFINFVAPLLIAGAMAVGLSTFALNVAHGRMLSIKQVFSGFDRFGTTLATYLLTIIFILLWTLLLIIPGIIAAFAYSQVFFVLADDPTITPMQAIERSKVIMRGNKWKFFCLKLRFIGWAILSVLSLGIGFLWLIPYIFVTDAKFYEDIKKHHEKKTDPLMV